MVDTAKGLLSLPKVPFRVFESFSEITEWIDKKTYELQEKYGAVPDEALELMNSFVDCTPYGSGIYSFVPPFTCPQSPTLEEIVHSGVPPSDTQYHPGEAADYVFSFISHVVPA